VTDKHPLLRGPDYQIEADIVERLHVIREQLRTGALGQREVWEEWLTEAADEIGRLKADGDGLLYEELMKATAGIARLTAALQRIDGINDNPACFNPMIDEVLREVLRRDQPGVAGEPEPEHQNKKPDLKADR